MHDLLCYRNFIYFINESWGSIYISQVKANAKLRYLRTYQFYINNYKCYEEREPPSAAPKNKYRDIYSGHLLFKFKNGEEFEGGPEKRKGKGEKKRKV